LQEGDLAGAKKTRLSPGFLIAGAADSPERGKPRSVYALVLTELTRTSAGADSTADEKLVAGTTVMKAMRVLETLGGAVEVSEHDNRRYNRSDRGNGYEQQAE
jgi:hypothetical protein